MEELDRIEAIISDLKQQKEKFTPEQYEQLMVYVLGMHAKLSVLAKETSLKPGELKVGDKVRVKKTIDPKIKKMWPPSWVSNMDETQGMVSKVRAVRKQDDGSPSYEVFFDDIQDYWNYRIEWLEKVK